MSGDGGGGGDSEQVSGPWEGVQPFLKLGYQGARENILDNPLEFYPDQTYVGWSPETQQAMDLTAERARQGSGLAMAGQTALGNMITQGGQNPYTNQVADSVMASVLPRVQGAFGGAGRTGDSPLAQAAVARETTRALAPAMFQDFRTGEAQRAGAIGMSPQLAATDFGDFARLAEVGRMREGEAGKELADRMARFQFEQQEPYQRMAQYMGLIGGAAPSQVVQTGGGGGMNPLMGALGAGLTIAGMPTKQGGSILGSVLGW